MEKPQLQLSKVALRTLATSNTLQNMSPKSFQCIGCRNVNSPVTNLALNLSELSTGRGETPRRKLSLSSLDTPNTSSNPTPERSLSIESGCFVDSPTPLDSPTLEMSLHRFSANLKADTEVSPEAVSSKRKTMAFRRFNSMPVPMMSLSPDLEHEVQTATAQSTPQCADNIECAVMDMSTDRITDISSDMSLSGSNDSGNSRGSSSGSMSPGSKRVFYIEENSSQDSGLQCDIDSRDAKDLDDCFEFAAPQGIPKFSRRHSKLISEDTCSPFKYSPIKDMSPTKRRNSFPMGSLDFSGEIVKHMVADEADSPLKMCRLTSVDEGIDDGFLDIMDEEVAKITTGSCGAISNLSSLFSAPIFNKSTHTTENNNDDDTPVTRRTMCRRNLQRSQSMDVRPRGLSFKRDSPDSDSTSPMQMSFKRDQPQDESTPIQKMKRRRPMSVIETSPTSSCPAPRPTFQRCHSESEAMIKSALARQANEPDLVGDCSTTYCLPTITGKHQDLKSISRETMSSVLEGKYSHIIEQAIIVDARYPYEFDGGHIEGAKNWHTTKTIKENFLDNPIRPQDPSKRVVLIFHCEFSSERGPKMSRFLRKEDRQQNKDCYPYLHYPEIYLLDMGYKHFFETEKSHCEPQTYKPMLHKDHGDDLKHFRTKSKSWAGQERGGRPNLRNFKL